MFGGGGWACSVECCRVVQFQFFCVSGWFSPSHPRLLGSPVLPDVVHTPNSGPTHRPSTIGCSKPIHCWRRARCLTNGFNATLKIQGVDRARRYPPRHRHPIAPRAGGCCPSGTHTMPRRSLPIRLNGRPWSQEGSWTPSSWTSSRASTSRRCSGTSCARSGSILGSTNAPLTAMGRIFLRPAQPAAGSQLLNASQQPFPSPRTLLPPSSVPGKLQPKY